MLVNGRNLTLEGALSGQNATIDVATAGDTLALGSGGIAAAITATGGNITLLADRITEIAGSRIGDAGTVTIAPFSTIPVSLAGAPGAHLLLDTTLLGEIGTTTLVIGNRTTTTAISVDGAVDLTGHAATLDLLSSGSITEPGGPITVTTLFASAANGVTLGSTLNAIGTIDGASAGGGNLVLVNGSNLIVAGTLSGQNATIDVATAGDTLALGSGAVTAALTATGTITLLADRITDTAGSSIATGTVTIAPVSANTVSLAGSPGAQLLLDTTLLDAINATTLIVGSSTTATAIAVDGGINLTGHAATLDLLTGGSITEPGGPIIVTTLAATAGTGIALGATANAIGTVDGAAAGTGNLLLTNGSNLTLAGTLSGQTATIALAPGDTLALGSGAIPAALTATGSITLLADRITDIAGSSIAASTVTIAPVSANTISLAGTPGAQLLLDATLLGDIGAGTLVIGNTTTTTGISVGGAASLIGHATTLDLLTSGSISEPGGPLSVIVLTATAGDGIVLGSSLNAIGTVDGASAGSGTLLLTNGTNLTLAGTLGGQTVTVKIAAAGNTLAIGSGAVTAAITATDSITLLADRITEIAGSSIADAGTVTIAPFAAGTVSLAGAPGAQLLLDTTLLGEISTSTLVIGSVRMPTIISVDGTVDLTGHAATLDLLTTGSIAEPGGPLTVGTLTAVAGTGIALNAAGNAIGTLDGVTSAAGGIVIDDASALTVAGPVGAGFVTLATAGSLDVLAGIVATNQLSLNAGGDMTIAASGPLDAGAIALSSGGTLDVLAHLTAAGPLTANASGDMTIASGASLAASTVTLTSSGSLDVQAGIVATNQLSLNAGGDMTIAAGGPLSAGAIALTSSGTLDVLAGVTATNHLALTAGGDLTLASTGTLRAGSATLVSGGSLDVEAGIAATGTLVLEASDAGMTLGSGATLTGGSVTLASNGTITSLAGITAADQLVFSALANLTLAGSAPVDAPTIAIDGSMQPIRLTGTGLIGSPSSTIELQGLAGITQDPTSTIQAAMLLTPGGFDGNVSLGGTANAIASLGPLSLTFGNLILADGGAGTLTVSGPVSAGNVTLGIAGGRPGTIVVTGSITAGGTDSLLPGVASDTATITLTSAGPITLTAGAIVSSTGTVGLTGSAVSEDAGAQIIANTLDSPGGIAGIANLAGTANAISALGDVAAGALLLADGTSLAVTGHAAGGGTVLIETTTPDTTILVPGTLTGQSITLDAGLGGIQITGSFDAATIAELDTAGGGVQQSGRFVAATLQSAGIVGPVTLGNASVATLGAFPVTGGNLSLTNTIGLVVAGPVSADNISLIGAGSMAIAGTLTTPGQVALTAGGPISEPTGSIVAGILAVSDTAPVSLGSTANAIATLGTVTVAGSSFLLADDAVPLLTVTGPVSAGSVALGTPTALTLAGAIAATGEVSLSAGSGGITIGTGTAAGSVTAATLLLSSGGTISEPNGRITAGQLIADSAGTLSLASTANAIAALGAVSVGNGDLVLADDAAARLTVNGPVTAANVTLDPTALVVSGAITAAGQLSLTAGTGGIAVAGSLAAGTLTLASLGSISEPGGSITAATLQGSSAGATDLGGRNAIGQITNFTAGTAFMLADTTALTLTGTLTAPLIALQMPTSAFTLANGAAIVTGGTPEPADFVLLDASAGGGLVIASELPTAAKPALSGGQKVGAYLTVGSFIQLGTSTVGAITAGGANILSITAPGTGNITFANLQGLNTWLLVDVNQGKVSGNIFVKALTLQYPAGYAGATLAGAINDITGPAAAGQATILPLPSNNFSLNHCPIHSINCVLLPEESIPAASPLENFSIGTLLDNNDDENLLLPIVSNQDY